MEKALQGHRKPPPRSAAGTARYLRLATHPAAGRPAREWPLFFLLYYLNHYAYYTPFLPGKDPSSNTRCQKQSLLGSQPLRRGGGLLGGGRQKAGTNSNDAITAFGDHDPKVTYFSKKPGHDDRGRSARIIC